MNCLIKTSLVRKSFSAPLLVLTTLVLNIWCVVPEKPIRKKREREKAHYEVELKPQTKSGEDYSEAQGSHTENVTRRLNVNKKHVQHFEKSIELKLKNKQSEKHTANPEQKGKNTRYKTRESV